MKSIRTGAGLTFLGIGIPQHPLLSGLRPSSTASASTAPAAVALALAALAQAGPTVVWMGMTEYSNANDWVYHRSWSDGRIETRNVPLSTGPVPGGGHYTHRLKICAPAENRVEVPPPSDGNGLACRTDINGDHKIDGADLSFVLDAWGQEGECEPHTTYPCLDLGNSAGRVALK